MKVHRILLGPFKAVDLMILIVVDAYDQCRTFHSSFSLLRRRNTVALKMVRRNPSVSA